MFANAKFDGFFFFLSTLKQLAVLPTAMKGRKDVVGAAETGSGKTLAFGIPILAGILKDKEFEERRANKQQVDVDESAENDDQEEKEETEEKEEEEEVEEVEEEEGERLQGVEEDLEHVDGIGLVRVVDDIKPAAAAAAGSAKKLRALIVTPTRELAVQIEKHLKAVARYTGIRFLFISFTHVLWETVPLAHPFERLVFFVVVDRLMQHGAGDWRHGGAETGAPAQQGPRRGHRHTGPPVGAHVRRQSPLGPDRRHPVGPFVPLPSISS